MRVLMFGWEFPPYNSGGLGVACWGLTRAMSDLGISVTFVLPKRFPFSDGHCPLVFGDDHGDISLRGVETLLTPYLTSSRYALLRGSSVDSFYGHSLLDEVLRYADVAGKIAREVPHDVIHAHDWLSFPAGIEAKRESGKPLVVHVHATEFDRVGSGQVNQAVYDTERQGMEVADRIIAVSQYTKDIIVAHYGISPEKIFVVHNGINESDFISETTTPLFLERLKKDGNKIVLFVGRLTLQKGPDYFVKVAQKVVQHFPNVYFVVSGSGDMEGGIIQSVSKANLSSKFMFTGFLRGEELSSIYKAADLYIMPSVSEPFGITPLEAAIHDTPVIISKQAGVSEVLHNALKVDFWDVDGIADKVVAILTHNSLHQSLMNGAHTEARSIGWKEAAEKCIMLYKQLVKSS